MADVKNFREINKLDVSTAGGKGASLGEMIQNGIPVPAGFVVLTTAFDQFIEETGLKAEIDSVLHTVDHNQVHTGEFASEKIRSLILGQEMPQSIADEVTSHFQELGAEYVAVRSSASAEDGADAAWAGQLESYLNTTEEDLLEKVRLCWSSLFTPRAIFYRFEKGFHGQHISVAVVVQKMVASEISGIAFSVHPVTEDYNQLIIEAGYGLGEAIVSGQITPDNYVIEKDKRQILDKYVSQQERGLFRIDGGGNEWRDVEKEEGGQQKLTDQQAIELADIVVGIEQHYGFPVDVEWAYEAGSFYVVQSRPITTLQKQEMVDEKWNSPALEGFDPSQYEFHGLWTCSILSDYFWSVIYSQELAEKIDVPLKEMGSFTMNMGNYLAKSTTRELLHDRIMRALKERDLKFFSNLKEVIDSEFKVAIGVIEKAAKQPIDGKVIRETTHALRRLGFLECTGYSLTNSFEPELLLWAKEHDISEQEINDYISVIDTPLIQRQEELTELKRDLEQRKILRLSDEEALKAISSLPDISKKFYDHIETFGWIEILGFAGEKLTSERLLAILRDFEVGEHAHKELQDLSDDSELFLKAASYLFYVREIGAEYFSMCSLAMRPILADVATKLSTTYSELNYLIPDEIAELVDSQDLNKLREILARRRTDKWALFEKDGQAQVVDDPADIKRLEAALLPKANSTGLEELRGQVGYAGVARGKVRVIMSSGDFAKMEKGDVLVTTMTTPDFVTLMQMASAIITDIGGLLSHAAIVSRELKKPCVIGTKFATQVLKDGDEVEVDANSGSVRRLTKKPDDAVETDFGTWKLGITRNMSFWHQWLSSLGHFHNSKDFGVKVPNRQLSVTIDGTQTSLFFTPENNSAYATAVMEAIDSRVKISELKSRYERFSDELEESLNKCNQDLSLGNWDDFTEKYQRLSAGLFLTSTIGRAGATKLTELLKEKGYSKEEVSEIVAVITYPDEHTPLFESRLDLLKVGERILRGDGKNKETLLEVWLDKHGSIPVNFCEEPWTLEDASNQLEEMLARDCSAELHKLAEGHHRKINDKNQLLHKIAEEEIEILALGLAEGTYLNEFRKNTFSRVSLAYRNIFAKIAKLGGSNDWRDCFYLLPGEMRDLLSGKVLDIAKIVSQRTKVGSYIDDDGEQVLLKKEDLHKFISFIDSAHGNSDQPGGHAEKTLKGFTANKGVIRGTARIVLSTKDFHKINRGDILVTTMTSVDFVPIMEKAGAFVTNEGGITSHASIVAREMNKPCIIGTQIATKLIKDGDEVKVDANTGTVTLLDG